MSYKLRYCSTNIVVNFLFFLSFFFWRSSWVRFSLLPVLSRFLSRLDDFTDFETSNVSVSWMLFQEVESLVFLDIECWWLDEFDLNHRI